MIIPLPEYDEDEKGMSIPKRGIKKMPQILGIFYGLNNLKNYVQENS